MPQVEEYDSDDYYYAEGGSKSGDMSEKYKDDIDGFESGLDGIQRSRGCTDCLCVIVFFAFLAGMGACTMYGFKNGQVNRITAPIDANNNFCGFGKMKGYPQMFITKWSAGDLVAIFKSGVCVKGCPVDKKHKFVEDKNCNSPSKGSTPCKLIKKSYSTVNVGDYCLPSSTDFLSAAEKKGYAAVKANFLNSKAGSFFMDMYLSSRAIYISMALSIFYSVLFIYLMSWFAEVIAWCCIVLVQIGLIGMSAACFMARKLSIDEVKKT